MGQQTLKLLSQLNPFVLLRRLSRFFAFHFLSPLYFSFIIILFVADKINPKTKHKEGKKEKNKSETSAQNCSEPQRVFIQLEE